MRVFIFSILIVLVVACGVALAQGTQFTYQGQLQNGGTSAAGNYDFEFLLYDSLSGGSQLGSTQTRGPVAVVAGTFSLNLDFGSQFPGANRFLEIRVRQTGVGTFTPLSPRQQINSNPYSVKSLNAAQLGGLDASQFVLASANIVNAATQFNLGGSRIIGTGGQTTNLLVGTDAGSSNPTGADNTFLGWVAGASATNASLNTFLGSTSGVSLVTGSGNSFIGYASGFGTTTGTNNTLLGRDTRLGADNLINATAIGANAVASQNHSLVLGSTFVRVGIGTSTPAFKLTVFDTSNTGLRVENGQIGGTIASFGGRGDFHIDTQAGVAGGRFAVSENGNVGIGINIPAYKLHVVDSSNGGIRVQTNIAGGTVASFGGAGAFYVDASGIIGGRFTVKENGNIGIGNPNPTDKLNVNGNISLLLASQGTTSVCQNAFAQISTCGSSIRYKTNINYFSSGLSLIKKLRPVSFTWKNGGMLDLGLVAEEVASVEPLLTTTNANGEIEGVKYDRLGVVLVNAVNEQQAQIEQLQMQVKEQQRELKQQRSAIGALTKLICSQDRSAQVCGPQN